MSSEMQTVEELLRASPDSVDWPARELLEDRDRLRDVLLLLVQLGAVQEGTLRQRAVDALRRSFLRPMRGLDVVTAPEEGEQAGPERGQLLYERLSVQAAPRWDQLHPLVQAAWALVALRTF